MEYEKKVSFIKVAYIDVLCQNFSVDTELVCTLDNLVLFQLLSLCHPIKLRERKHFTGTWLYGMAISWYMMLVWIIIPLRVIIQVKIEYIRTPQNTCGLGTACFSMRHISVWTFFAGASLGHDPYGLFYFIF